MGCWSEGCALTGLEIVSGAEVYVACLGDRQDEFDGQSIAIPPVKGIYDDYGGISLVEDFSILGLSRGEHWEPHETHRPIFIHAAIFEKLEKLQPEFDFTEATLGTQLDQHAAEIVEYVNLARSDSPDAPVRGLATKAPSLLRAECWTDIGIRIEDAIDNPEQLDEVLLLYRRGKLLKSAEFELRRPLTYSRIGPQHGGAEATRQLTDWTRQILENDRETARRQGQDRGAPGSLYDFPLEARQTTPDQVEIVSADGQILWARVAPSRHEPRQQETEIGRCRAFAEWMVNRLNG